MMTHGFGKARFEQEGRKIRPLLLDVALSLLSGAIDADDAVQETLLKMWCVKERIADDTHFRKLAMVTVRNVCLNMLRDMKVRRADTLSDEIEISGGENPQSIMERDELIGRVREVWGNLPQQYRIILNMKEAEHLSNEEIASLLGTTVANVRNRLSRARKEMLARMGNFLK